MTMLIGLSGYARSGKDTVGAYLVEHHGFTRVAFADALKDALYALNPIVRMHTRVQEIVDDVGWDAAKAAHPEIRVLLQRLGTEVGRETFWTDFWVDLAARKIDAVTTPVVLTDCRFPNEADMVQDRGGSMWRIERPGTAPVNAHASETALDEHSFDRWLVNGSDLRSLYLLVDDLVEPL